MGNRIVRALVLAIGLPASSTVPRVVTAQESTPKVTVAILNFDVAAMIKGEEYGPLAQGIPIFLGTELATLPNVKVVESDRIDQILKELGLQASGKVDPESAVRAGKLLGAQYLVLGGFIVDPKNRMSLHGRVVNVETRGWDYVAKSTGKGDDVYELIADLAKRLTPGMHMATPRGVSRNDAPKGEDAYGAIVLVAHAAKKRSEGDKEGAVQLLRRVLDVYPTCPEAKQMLTSMGAL